MCPRSLRSSNATPAALYRVIEQSHPVVLMDEFDSVNPQAAGDLRNILNASFERGQLVLRTVGDGKSAEVRAFSTFGPVAIAAIKGLPPTVVDRSILITLDRKPGDVTVERFRGNALSDLRCLNSKITRWVADRASAFEPGSVMLPDELNDRAQDIWEPLLTLAAMLGSQVLDNAQSAAKDLAASDTRQDDDIGIELLRDIDEQYLKWPDHVPTQIMVDTLNRLEGRPWSEFGHGKGLTTTRLGKYLRQFGMTSEVKREGERTERGYDRDALQVLALTYLGKTCNTTSATNESLMKHGMLHVTRKTRYIEGGEREERVTADPRSACDGLSDRSTITDNGMEVLEL